MITRETAAQPAPARSRPLDEIDFVIVDVETTGWTPDAAQITEIGAVKISAHKPDDAQKIAEEIMTLQPEGRVNAEARLLAGEVQLERGNFDDAGKAFKGVALLYDDPAITPRALDKAAVAYRQAGKAEEADRLSHELRERYPNYAGG